MSQIRCNRQLCWESSHAHAGAKWQAQAQLPRGSPRSGSSGLDTHSWEASILLTAPLEAQQEGRLQSDQSSTRKSQ